MGFEAGIITGMFDKIKKPDFKFPDTWVLICKISEPGFICLPRMPAPSRFSYCRITV